MRRWALALVLLAFLAMPALAQDASTSAVATADFAWQDYRDPGADRAPGNPITEALGFIIKLGAVIGLIYGVAYLYRKGLLPRSWVGGMGYSATGTNRLRVLETLPLRGAQSLHVVEAGDRLLVLGSNGKETLVKLAELPPGGFDTTLREVAQAERGFTDELESTLQRVMRPERGQP